MWRVECWGQSVEFMLQIARRRNKRDCVKEKALHCVGRMRKDDEEDG